MPDLLLTSALWALLAPIPVDPGEVELDGSRWEALQPPSERAPGPMVLRRDVTISPAPGGVKVVARWALHSERDAWFGNQILGPTAHLRRARWGGSEATVWSGGQGALVVERLDGAVVLEVEALIPGDPANGVDLTLMGAPRGVVTLEGFSDPMRIDDVAEERPVVRRGAGGFSTGASQLHLGPPAPPPPGDRGPVVVAHVGMGLTVGDAEIRGRARLRWEIRQGSRDTLTFVARDVGDDLEVEGPQVSRWTREGDRIRVELGASTEGRVDVDLRWSVAVPSGAEARMALPELIPDDVFRSDAAVQLARDGEVDVRPDLSAWTPVAARQLPDWAEGLVEGSPTAALTRTRVDADDGALDLLRLEPVPGPSMVIDVADVRLATTELGRTVLRARYEVRNERASHLELRPPPGMRLVGVTVAGRPVTPGRSGDALRIPLPRSIETLGGALAVPVTVGLLGEGDGWARRERRAMPLPRVDAPVNVLRVAVHLPVGYVSQATAGTGAVVEAFSQGDAVAYGFDDDAGVAWADEVFAGAVDAWNDNDFALAQQRLDALILRRVTSDDIRGLQANLDLVRPPTPEIAVFEPEDADKEALRTAEEGDDVTVYEFADEELEANLMVRPESAVVNLPAPAQRTSAAARRIRARVRARSGKKKQQFDRRKRRAKSLKNEGRYDEAADAYREALEDSRDLGALEDAESVEYEVEAQELRRELEQVESHTRPEPEAAAEPEPAEQISRFVSPDDELDLVGGIVVHLDPSPDDPVAITLERAHGPVVMVPRIGELVRYEHRLLDGGEGRTVDIHARRTERLPRRRYGR
ncbi:MAG: tetratricopeptide repeat protein [Deltaproteobacteria bacterium]|nr:tetratricopeptide repeat protein [Deltaproteobacteria bacterium]